MFEEGQFKKLLKTNTQKQLAMQQQTKQPQIRIGLIWLCFKLGSGCSLTDKQPQDKIGLIWLGFKLGLGYSLTDYKSDP